MSYEIDSCWCAMLAMEVIHPNCSTFCSLISVIEIQLVWALTSSNECSSCFVRHLVFIPHLAGQNASKISVPRFFGLIQTSMSWWIKCWCISLFTCLTCAGQCETKVIQRRMNLGQFNKTYLQVNYKCCYLGSIGLRVTLCPFYASLVHSNIKRWNMT